MKIPLGLIGLLGSVFFAWAEAPAAPKDLPPVESLLPDSSAQEELFAAWPPVQLVVQKAMLNLPKTVREQHAWTARQRASALLPTLKLAAATVERNFVNYEIEQDPNNNNRLTDLRETDGVRDYNDEAISLTWDLSDFVFSGEEVDGVTAEREMEQFRISLKQQTIQAYYGLREARIRLAQGVYGAKEDRLQVETLAHTYQAMLDTLTGGFFSDYIAASEEADDKLSR